MKKMVLFLVMLGVLIIGLLNVYHINDTVKETLISSAVSAQGPGDAGFSSTLKLASTLGTYWYLLIAVILLLIIMMEG